MKETKIYPGKFNTYLMIRKQNTKNYHGLLEIAHNTFMALDGKYCGTIWIASSRWLNRRYDNFYEYIMKVIKDVYAEIDIIKKPLDDTYIYAINYNFLRIMCGMGGLSYTS